MTFRFQILNVFFPLVILHQNGQPHGNLALSSHTPRTFERERERERASERAQLFLCVIVHVQYQFPWRTFCLGPGYVKLLWTTHSQRLWKIEDPLLWIFQSFHWYRMLCLNLAGRFLSSWVLRQASFVFCFGAASEVFRLARGSTSESVEALGPAPVLSIRHGIFPPIGGFPPIERSHGSFLRSVQIRWENYRVYLTCERFSESNFGNLPRASISFLHGTFSNGVNLFCFGHHQSVHGLTESTTKGSNPIVTCKSAV